MHSAAQHALDHCAKSDKTATSASVNETESLSLAFEMDYFTMYMHKSSGQVPMHGGSFGQVPMHGSSGQVPMHGDHLGRFPGMDHLGRFPCMDHLCERQMKVVIV